MQHYAVIRFYSLQNSFTQFYRPKLATKLAENGAEVTAGVGLNSGLNQCAYESVDFFGSEVRICFIIGL